MRCPTCGRKLPENQMECPRCAQNRLLMDAPLPIGPQRSGGSLALALVSGLSVATAGAFGWLLLDGLFATVQTWPSVVLGILIGLTVRITGGMTQPNAKGMIGGLCGAAGIIGGLVLILFQRGIAGEQIQQLATFEKLIFPFIGLSLAKSLATSKKLLGELKKQAAAFGSPLDSLTGKKPGD